MSGRATSRVPTVPSDPAATHAEDAPPVDPIDALLAHNRTLASTGFQAARGPAARGALQAPPSRRVAIVTCMDARLDLPAALGLQPGEAHVIRNAGGVVTDDVIRSLAISQRLLGTRAVLLAHHTRCGMLGLDDAALRAELTRAAGSEPPFAIGGFADLDGSVRASLARVRSCAFLPHRDHVRGFVYDVDTHLLREVPRPDEGRQEGTPERAGEPR